MKKNLLLALIGLLIVGGVVVTAAMCADDDDQPVTPPPVPAGGVMLSVCQDESTVEEQVAVYLETKHKLKLERKKFPRDPNDLYLVIPFRVTDAPALRVLVDTQVSARNQTTKRVTERCIKVEAAFVVPAAVKRAPGFRTKLLDYNNKWMMEHWSPGQVYVDKDGDVAMQTYTNIPGPEFKVHAEMVYDAIARMVSAWKGYYAGLKGVINLDDEEPAPAD